MAKTGPPEVKPYRRRSGRIARRLTVVLRWKDLDGNPHEDLAETVLLSRYGGLLVCSTRFKSGEEAYLWWPEKQRGSQVRVVYRRLGGSEDLVEVGFEFLDIENFWGIDFPPEKPPWERPRRRRSARIPRRLAVAFRLYDAEGKTEEVPAHTILLSRYGGLVASRASFKPGEEVYLWWPEKQKGAWVRILTRRLVPGQDTSELAFEFLSPEDFWGIQFARDVAPWERPPQTPR